MLTVYFHGEGCLFGKTYLKEFDFLIPFLIVGMTFPIVGLIHVGICLICFVIYIIRLKNLNFKG